MPVQVGIVGLANAGKSTLFNALCGGGAQVDSYPYTTTSPNIGMARVPDSDLDRLVARTRPKSVVQATLRVVDIAGLSGNAGGDSLGGKFLGQMREMDALLLTLRAFEAGVPNPQETLDPVRDLESIETELLLADLETVRRRMEDAEKQARSNKPGGERLPLLRMLDQALGAGRPARSLTVNDEQAAQLREMELLTTRPVVYVVNTEEGASDAVSPALAERARSEGALVVAASARIEAELAELSPEEAAAFRADMGEGRSALESVVRACYEALGLITFYTSGDKEARAWPIPAGISARRAAGEVHTDIERGFIRAEVMNLDDLLSAGSFDSAKAKGQMRLEGKDYIVQDKDVVYFRFNV
ncbi:MAG: redox-regulated ATPase YchF [Candidatus Dormibacteria bacterium]